MNFSTSSIRICQLPVSIFGIIHDAAFNGIRMSIFAYTNTTLRREDSPALT